MNRPKQLSVRVTPNRHFRNQQPFGYYSQVPVNPRPMNNEEKLNWILSLIKPEK